MTAVTVVLTSVAQAAAEESYSDLLRSGPRSLFEVTLELLTAPMAFGRGWL